jgi:hypothetical protein
VTKPAWWTAALVLAILVLPGLGAVTTVAAASAPALAPTSALVQSGPSHGVVATTNWAGYAVTGAKNSVSLVRGSWVEPTAVSCPLIGHQYSAFWVGIDGFNSTTVEQTGTDVDCAAGVAHYYAWYEFYPNPSYQITKVPIHAGDTINASVQWVNSTVGFRVTLTDATTGKSASHTAKVPSALRDSAEWIAEAPYSSLLGILPLTDFGTVHFGTDATGVAGTNDATIGGAAHAIGAFASTAIWRVNMINVLGTQTKAATSALTPDGTSFNVTWKHAGP